ncbi:DUF4232 domain-containing protein [Microbacterium sp. SL62]|uniref:DUF4232 domain-containing protein n=1 Tax=Microbacterium sp. SL62 TaxID=2995139 RepID=UPI0022770292|nr:DUF4232 domain-containing protein [Microbacterium sp. SL62]MCY1715492.1 DUF4232 domain-containing protein [Microbacterium sp. SL62]
MSPLRPRLVTSALVAAVLWVAVAGARDVLLQIPSGLAQAASLVPQLVPTTLTVYQSEGAGLVPIVVGGVAVGLLSLAFAVLARRGGSTFLSSWFGVVVAGALVGLGLDLGAGWSWLAMFGPRGLSSSGFGVAAASGALWGLVGGWIPALIARERGAVGDASASRRILAPLVSLAVVAVVAVVVTGALTDSARAAAIAAEAAAQREVDAAHSFGALPDPDAPGEPVPETADAVLDVDAQWCTPDKATVLSGEPDAATGHRGMPIRLMNFSDQPCVIEGYPDVAFGDQNGHLLDVTIEHGRSFMAQDPGPLRVEVPAGGYAISILGWDAASPHGALVTHTVWAAQTPGMARGSWPIELDIVEGSTVAVTAWTVDVDPTSPG